MGELFAKLARLEGSHAHPYQAASWAPFSFGALKAQR
jgi:hypothetical protein